MKKFPLILYSLYAIFHIGLVGIAFYANSLWPDKVGDLLELGKSIPMTRWLSLLGLLLFLVNGGFILSIKRSFKEKVEELEKEKNVYKAKMFDMQEANSQEATPQNLPETDGSANTDS